MFRTENIVTVPRMKDTWINPKLSIKPPMLKSHWKKFKHFYNENSSQALLLSSAISVSKMETFSRTSLQMRFNHFFRHFRNFGAYIVIEKNNTIFFPYVLYLQVLVCLFITNLLYACIYQLRLFINTMSL